MEKLCRICRKPEENKRFKHFFDQRHGFAEKLYYLASITVFEVSSNEAEKAWICQQCEVDLNTATRLKKMSIISDERWKRISSNDDLNLLTALMNGSEEQFEEQVFKQDLEEIDSVVKIEVLDEFRLELLEGSDNELLEVERPDFNYSSSFQTDDKLQIRKKVHKDKPKKTRKSKPKSKELFQCTHESCGKIFQLASKYKVHLKSHSEVRNYHCDQCDKSYKSAGSLNSHVSEKHLKIERRRKIYQCTHENCGKILNSTHKFNRHKETHWEGTNFTCETCGKGFKTPKYLQRHQKIHTSSASFECDICGSISSSRGSIFTHMMFQHSKENSYKRICHLCGKTLSSGHNLKTHMLYSHGGERNFTCNVCSKSFFTRSKLKQHEQAIHGERPYECQICSRNFAMEYRLREHLKQRHLSKEISTAKKLKCSICNQRFEGKKHLQHHLIIKHEVVNQDDNGED